MRAMKPHTLGVLVLTAVAPLGLAQEPIRSADLRPEFERLGLATKAQGRRPTCSVCVTVAAIEFAVSRREGVSRPMSVEYANWAANQVLENRTEDRGQFFHHLLEGFDRFGLCSESAMPYEARWTATEPSAEAKAEAARVRESGLAIRWIKPWGTGAGVSVEELESIRAALESGWPVAAGASHSTVLVAFEDDPGQPGGGRFVVADSGAGGYG